MLSLKPDQCHMTLNWLYIRCDKGLTHWIIMFDLTYHTLLVWMNHLTPRKRWHALKLLNGRRVWKQLVPTWVVSFKEEVIERIDRRIATFIGMEILWIYMIFSKTWMRINFPYSRGWRIGFLARYGVMEMEGACCTSVFMLKKLY